MFLIIIINKFSILLFPWNIKSVRTKLLDQSGSTVELPKKCTCFIYTSQITENWPVSQPAKELGMTYNNNHHTAASRAEKCPPLPGSHYKKMQVLKTAVYLNITGPMYCWEVFVSMEAKN